MGTVNRKMQTRHDGQKNYDHSNHRNPDHARSDTQKHVYKEFDETLTNDENYSLDSKQIKGDPDFSDRSQNEDPGKSQS